MARYKHIDTSPRLLAVDLSQQRLPGTFEHALNYLLDHEMDLTGLDARFCMMKWVKYPRSRSPGDVGWKR